MTDLRLIPKPEGFDLRNKRSDKSGDAADWEVQDALYDVSQECVGKKVVSVLIFYEEEVGETGKLKTKMRYAGGDGACYRLMLRGLGKMMDWDK